jgi:hypothetical protein
MAATLTRFMRTLLCPCCGSFLDSPRVGPSGAIGRKCPVCLEWYERVPDPEPGEKDILDAWSVSESR